MQGQGHSSYACTYEYIRHKGIKYNGRLSYIDAPLCLKSIDLRRGDGSDDLIPVSAAIVCHMTRVLTC